MRDERNYLPYHPNAYKCPIDECQHEAKSGIYKALIVAPDGRQRACWGCVEDLPRLVEAELLTIREHYPPPDL